jgi:hypothetical protein
MRFYSLFIAIFTLLLPSAYAQGITGKVIWVTGNQMPGPGVQRTAPEGIRRTIWIYEATRTEQAEQTGAFFKNVSTRLIRKVKSRRNGTFRVKLPPGRYTLFVQEKNGLFANQWDGNGCIQCVAVVARNWTTCEIRVDYTAAY